MPTQSNKHIRKFNQLVDVYDPDGVEAIETVTSRDDGTLERRKEEIVQYRTQVEQLGPADFFDEQRRTEIAESDSLPEPSAVADSQRGEMVDRLDAIEAALSDALLHGDILDTSDDLEL